MSITQLILKMPVSDFCNDRKPTPRLKQGFGSLVKTELSFHSALEHSPYQLKLTTNDNHKIFCTNLRGKFCGQASSSPPPPPPPRPPNMEVPLGCRVWHEIKFTLAHVSSMYIGAFCNNYIISTLQVSG